MEDEMKFCPKCGKTKRLNDFHVMWGRVTDWCLECLRAEEERLHAQARRYTEKRQALLRAAGDRYTHWDIDRLYRAQNGRCYYCGEELGEKYHVDHYMPLSRGGSNTLSNLVIACPTCNLSKHNKTPDEFEAQRRRRAAQGQG